RKLQAKGKNVNITIVAVAREQVVLSGIWGGIAMFVAQ
ncbi:IS110 family transposase, partial [Escherichia coli]